MGTPQEDLDKFSNLTYAPGFGNLVSSEALPGALPIGQNSPQVCPYGLYAEQLSGSAFTAPRHKNLKTWLYRIRPSVLHEQLVPLQVQPLLDDFHALVIEPNQLRWSPYPLCADHERRTFINGLRLYAAAGEVSLKEGVGIYMYSLNAPMLNEAMYSADGDLLLVPQLGQLGVQTELGLLSVGQGELAVLPRGVKFRVVPLEPVPCRGYMAEVYKGHFELPQLGPIGANGLANARDFESPVAFFEDTPPSSASRPYRLVVKYMHKLFETSLPHSPFDVVAWHGNYVPFKYDLKRFNAMNTVSFDHPDPSIFTVLTCPSDEPGTAALDFVVFPPRWMVGAHTFRPPYFHRNVMTEFMGMLYGTYDGKASTEKGGFEPGGASLHSLMTAHGPDALSFVRASSAALGPHYYDQGLAFMFETCYLLKVSRRVLTVEEDGGWRQGGYRKCWERLPRLFNPQDRDNALIDWEGVKRGVEGKEEGV